jgi:hypothetical protein
MYQEILRMFPHVIPSDQDLIDYVEGARRLRDVNVISLDEWEKWSSQVRESHRASLRERIGLGRRESSKCSRREGW